MLFYFIRKKIMKKKFIVYKEKTIIYATIVEAKDEEEASLAKLSAR